MIRVVMLKVLPKQRVVVGVSIILINLIRYYYEKAKCMEVSASDCRIGIDCTCYRFRCY